MELIQKIRRKHVQLMRLTCATLGHILAGVSQEEATTCRDGPEGWTVLEVVGHLRDFDGFFFHRAQMILREEAPDLPAYDHEALAVSRAYNRENLGQTYAELVRSRERFIEFFENLSEADWERAGVHPEQGHFTMTEAAMQVGMHEINHLEQITRILTHR